ncbi:nucleoside-diphosphate sugar epimerase [Nocardiopsis sp. TSRI0078]|uniref:SDR family oxidoreductase n=1 Tax=unclassified Nocardiopsis TaxID=2649073 RepID=UPI00093DB0EE|nr:NAD(P)H-binding protein [Nocardiopsis sp. TSRI0078]OKI22879.1 nucleoside-diphosphate sugar epimerase [Nocardiopsis sp. TSRI0078]
MKTVLVTGGTGTLGSLVVERLRRAGHQVRSLSRHPAPQDPSSFSVDLRRGTGLADAVQGADTVVHCATTPAGGDIGSAAHLLRALRRAGVKHLVYISIVGVDRIPLGYYRNKHTVERALEASGLGWSVLRATQFHDLVLTLCAGAARLPLMPVPQVEVQPVDAGEVAARLTRLAEGDPVGRVPDMGGPRVESFHDLAGAYLSWAGPERRLLPVRLPGSVFAAYREGHHLSPERAVGTVTFQEFLDRRTTG